MLTSDKVRANMKRVPLFKTQHIFENTSIAKASVLYHVTYKIQQIAPEQQGTKQQIKQAIDNNCNSVV